MLLWVCTIHIALRHLLHHKITIDFHVFGKLPAFHPPLSSNCQSTNGRFGIDEGVDPTVDVGEGKLIGGLTDGLLIGDRIDSLTGWVARVEFVRNERRAESFDHELMVVESGDDLFGSQS